MNKSCFDEKFYNELNKRTCLIVRVTDPHVNTTQVEAKNYLHLQTVYKMLIQRSA